MKMGIDGGAFFPLSPVEIDETAQSQRIIADGAATQTREVGYHGSRRIHTLPTTEHAIAGEANAATDDGKIHTGTRGLERGIAATGATAARDEGRSTSA